MRSHFNILIQIIHFKIRHKFYFDQAFTWHFCSHSWTQTEPPEMLQSEVKSKVIIIILKYYLYHERTVIKVKTTCDLLARCWLLAAKLLMTVSSCCLVRSSCSGLAGWEVEVILALEQYFASSEQRLLN